jgi:hypothetical protein
MIETKQLDANVPVEVNADLSSATLLVNVQLLTAGVPSGVAISLPATFTEYADGVSIVTVTTSSLAVGAYYLEVRATINGKPYTFPDGGYLLLIVNPRL